jgi:hypothetical protein
MNFLMLLFILTGAFVWALLVLSLVVLAIKKVT